MARCGGEDDCVNIAIVGAGVSGLCAALRLCDVIGRTSSDLCKVPPSSSTSPVGPSAQDPEAVAPEESEREVPEPPEHVFAGWRVLGGMVQAWTLT